ncbi:MAG: molybdopterin-dependent oxidoreductase [Telluria sp.]
MNKRQFLGSATLAALAPVAAQAAGNARGPVLLTVTGAIGRSNRGALDPALDQMMHKQQLQFDRAFTFDFAELARLPARTIRPTVEYDARPHTLRGPLLTDVLAQAGATNAGKVLLRAVDGYAVELPVAQARSQGFIVATHLDGQAMPLGGLGPLWAVYDADRVPEMANKTLVQRFANCPWGLYHIAVQA